MATKRNYVRTVLMAVAALIVVLVLAWIHRTVPAIRIGLASVSQVLCEEVYIAGLDPHRVYAEEVVPRPGLRPLLRHLRYQLDPARRSVQVNWTGHFNAIAQDLPGYGCRVVPALLPLTVTVPDAVPQHESPAVATIKPALSAALDRAFAEPAQAPYRQVRAIVVMHRGQIIAERYAPGITPDTPLLDYSASKSVINALVGILVRQGKLQLDRPTGLAAWQDAHDPRRAITLDQLLRMNSGLDLPEEDNGRDAVSKMLFRYTDDMAGYAESARLVYPPGTHWAYSSGNTLIAAAIVRDAVGGSAEAVQQFARTQLFGPLGMQHVTMELDARGTPVGSTRILASARDWARFGELYLDHGVVNGQRLLPADWVTYVTTPTLGNDYGASFWLNGGSSEDERWRVQHGMPKDAYFASGLFGQRVLIIPSQQLVIVRMGQTMGSPTSDMPGLVKLSADVIAAMQSP